MSANWNRYDMRSTNRGVSSGRAQRRVGMDYSLTQGTSALAPYAQPEPKIERVIRQDEMVTIRQDGVEITCKVVSIRWDWTVRDTVFTLKWGVAVLELTAAALREIEVRPDANIPLLPFRASRTIELGAWGRIVEPQIVEPGRVLPMPAPIEQTSAAIA